MQKKGFTMIEVLLILGIAASLSMILFQIVKFIDQKKTGILNAKYLLEFAQSGVRYVSMHQSLLDDSLLDSNGQSNGQVVYVPMQLLKNEGVLASTYPETNRQKQVPCLAISSINNQLSAFAYYKGTNTADSISERVLREGALAIGSAIGIYEGNLVVGVGKNWKLANANSVLNSVGIALQNGVSTDSYSCLGGDVPESSYVISLQELPDWNIASPALKMTNLNTNHDDTSSVPDASENYNTVHTALNMYDFESKVNHAVIFKLPQNCRIDPENPQSCMNKAPYTNLSLGIGVANEAEVGGFAKDSYSSKLNGYVGNLKVQTYRPTTIVEIGTKCTQEELGTEAIPANTQDSLDVNKFFISKVKCMASPMCGSAGNLCYLPLNTVTVVYSIKNSSAYTMSSYSCPNGTFMIGYTSNPEPVPSPCSGSVFWQPYSCHINSCASANSCATVVESGSIVIGQYLKAYRSIYTTPSKWYQGCPDLHPGCGGGWLPDSYRQITSVTCSNDPSKIGLAVAQ